MEPSRDLEAGPTTWLPVCASCSAVLVELDIPGHIDRMGQLSCLSSEWVTELQMRLLALKGFRKLAGIVQH